MGELSVYDDRRYDLEPPMRYRCPIVARFREQRRLARLKTLERSKVLSPPPKREALQLRDGVNCGICGLEMAPHDMTIDHIVPKSHLGSNELSNLRLAHETCNMARGSSECPKCAAGACARTACIQSIA